ncbi:MAG TPA: hypothetical protein EYQ53_04560 [Candidatus Poseidoniales archaeon]|nr:MAG: hypothetical protein CXT67_00950 [Euryarchaeota archaeon]HIG03636.1 hypothetical protein [Candidatus Poseidoniales archaeon]
MRRPMTVILLATLFIIGSSIPLIETTNEELNSLNSKSTITISSNSEWNGNYSLNDDVIINQGVTLTIKPNTVIDITSDITISVFGIIKSNETTIMSNLPASISGSSAGLWTGIEIMAGGTAILNTTEVQNARTGVSVLGSLYSDSIEFSTSYVGMDVDGTATIDTMTCNDIDIVCAKITGVGDIGELQVVNASTGIYQSGTLSVDDAELIDVGIGFDVDGASGSHNNIILNNVNTAWRVRSQTAVTAQDVDCISAGLLIDAGDSDGFEISNVVGIADRVVRAEGMQELTLTNVNLSSLITETTAIDARNDGDLMIIDSIFQGYSNGMKLRGSGTHSVHNSEFSVMSTGIQGSGSGELIFNQSNLFSAGDIGEFSQLDSTFEYSDLSGGNAATIGLSWTGGNHVLNSVNISRPYAGSSDLTSVGIGAWWSTVVGNSVSVSGWHIGVECESCTIDFGSTSIYDGGTGDGTSISGNNANMIFDYLETQHSTTAVDLQGISTFVSSYWIGDQHNNALFVGDDSSAAIRDFNTNIIQGVDAVGGGVLHWGTSDSTPPTVTVSNTKEYTETTFTITDLVGNTLENVYVETGPWSESSDINGDVTLPLFATGSEVEAVLGGTGASEMMQGGVSSQVLQIPIIPSGDWTIPNGLNVVLSATSDGSPHELSGNLTIESGGSIFLDSTTLSLPSSNSVSIQSGGILTGDSGIINGGSGLFATGSTPLFGSGQGLTLGMPATIDCGGVSMLNQISISLNLTLGAGCDLTISQGSITGEVILGTSSFLQVKNTLYVLVLDAGAAVENVNLNVGGVTFITNATGQASMSYTARSDDASGTVWYGSKFVAMQRSGHQQYFDWDLNYTMEHTFISSTLTSGVLSDWTILDSEWSPWFLEDDLLIPAGQTLSILDNTELVVASNKEISILGTLTLGEATIHSTGGDPWVGLTLSGSEAVLEASGGHIVEATLPISASGSAELTLSGTEVARGIDGLILLSTSSGNINADLVNVNLHDSSTSCVYSQGEGIDLSMDGISATNCGDHGVWIRQSTVSINDLTLGVGNDEGMELADVNGVISNVDSTTHDGASASIYASEINGDLLLENLNLGVGTSSPALEVINSRNFNLDGLQVIGSPAVDFDTIAGSISNLQLVGSGSGTGVIAHHARGSGALTISQSSVTNYSVALDLHGSTGEATNPRLVSTENIWSGITAISSDGRAFESVDDEIFGVIAADSNTELQSDIYNAVSGPISSPSSSDSGDITVVGDASIVFWWDISFAATLDGLETQADVDLTLDLPLDMVEFSDSGLSPSMTIPFHIVDASGSQRATISITASADGGLPYSDSFAIDERLDSQYTLPIDINTLPIIQIISPDDGLTFMQGSPLVLNATATDVESDFNELQIQWSIMDMMGERVWSSLEWNDSQYGLAVGSYIVKAEVTDSHGGVSSEDVEIVVIALDSDGDWTPTCNEEWYDIENGVQCGPDEYDSDDDNDGVSDERDAWPTDSCASEDSDADGMPDSIHCPENMETDLIEDYDDDNDGVLDIDENKAEEESSFSMSTVVAVFILLGLGYYIMNRDKFKS